MSSDNIKVAIRIRPLLSNEKSLKLRWRVKGNEIFALDERELEIYENSYAFDHIFDSEKKNEDVYKMIEPLVITATRGINSTILAYGQTASGKTHSMIGHKEDAGIISRAADTIFDEIKRNTDRRFLLRAQMIEIYNEKINDLLNLENLDLKIREDCFGNLAISNVSEEITSDKSALLKILKIGNSNRHVGGNNVNVKSSRSHVIFKVIIESTPVDDKDETRAPVQVSHLYIVDLAGSERITQTKATGERRKEGLHINKSLSTLTLCIHQLSEGQEFINFRDSKLTRILSNGLGGNSKTLILATIMPVEYENSQSTLSFAKCAKLVKTKPVVNEVLTLDAKLKRHLLKEKWLTRELEEEKMKGISKDQMIHSLEKQLTEIRSHYVHDTIKSSSRRHTLPVKLNTIQEIPYNLEPPIESDHHTRISLATREAEGVDNTTMEFNPSPILTPLQDDGSEDDFEINVARSISNQSLMDHKSFLANEFDCKLQDIKEKHEEEIQTLAKENSLLKAKCEKLEINFYELEITHDNYRKKYEARERDLLMFNEEMQNKLSSVQKHASTIEKLNEDVFQLQQKLRQAEKIHATPTEENNKIKSEKPEDEENFARQNNTFNNGEFLGIYKDIILLQNIIAGTEDGASVEELSSKNEDLCIQIKKLCEENEELCKKLKSYAEYEEKLIEETRKLQRNLVIHENSKNENFNLLESKNSELAKLIEERKESEIKLEEMKERFVKESSQKTEEITKLSEEKCALEEHLFKYKNDFDEEKEFLQSKINQLENLQENFEKDFEEKERFLLGQISDLQNVQKEISMQNEALQEEINKLSESKITLEGLQKKLENLNEMQEEEIRRLKSENEELEDQFTKKISEVRNYKGEITELLEEKHAFEEKLKNFEEREIMLQARIKTLEDLHKQLYETNASLKEENEIFKIKKEEETLLQFKVNDLENLQKQIENKNVEITTLKSACMEKEDLITKKTEEIKNLQKLLANEKNIGSCKFTTKDMTSLQEDCDVLKSMLIEKQTLLQNYETEIKKIKENSRCINPEEYETFLEEFNNLKRILREKNEEIIEKQQEIQSLEKWKEENFMLSEKIDTLKKQEDFMDLKNILDQKEILLQKQFEEIGEVKRKIAEKSELLSQKDDLIEELKENLKELIVKTAKTESLKILQEEHKECQFVLEKRNDELSKECKNLSFEIEELQKVIIGKEKIIEEKQSDLKVCSDIINQQKNEMKNLKKEISNLELLVSEEKERRNCAQNSSSEDSLRIELETLKNNLKNKEELLEMKDLEINELNKEMKKLEEEHANKLNAMKIKLDKFSLFENRKVSKTEQENGKLKKEYSDLNSKMFQILSEKTTAIMERDKALEDLKKNCYLIDELKKQQTEYEIKGRMLQEEIASKKHEEEFKKLQNDLLEYERTLNSSKTTISNLQSDCLTKEKSLEESLHEKKKISEELHKVKTAFSKIESDKQKIVEEKKKIFEEFSKLKNESVKIVEERNEIVEELKNKRNNIERLEEDCRAKEKLIEELKLQMYDLENELKLVKFNSSKSGKNTEDPSPRRQKRDSLINRSRGIEDEIQSELALAKEQLKEVHEENQELKKNKESLVLELRKINNVVIEKDTYIQQLQIKLSDLKDEEKEEIRKRRDSFRNKNRGIEEKECPNCAKLTIDLQLSYEQMKEKKHELNTKFDTLQSAYNELEKKFVNGHCDTKTNLEKEKSDEVTTITKKYNMAVLEYKRLRNQNESLRESIRAKDSNNVNLNKLREENQKLKDSFSHLKKQYDTLDRDLSVQSRLQMGEYENNRKWGDCLIKVHLRAVQNVIALKQMFIICSVKTVWSDCTTCSQFCAQIEACDKRVDSLMKLNPQFNFLGFKEKYLERISDENIRFTNMEIGRQILEFNLQYLEVEILKKNNFISSILEILRDISSTNYECDSTKNPCNITKKIQKLLNQINSSLTIFYNITSSEADYISMPHINNLTNKSDKEIMTTFKDLCSSFTEILPSAYENLELKYNHCKGIAAKRLDKLNYLKKCVEEIGYEVVDSGSIRILKKM